MRRSLIWTVGAVVAMVLIAMLVPMAVLVRSYALEDRLSRAALEVQATETVVSGDDKGAVAVYLDAINRDAGTQTTVYYPDGTAIGPDPGEDDRVREARRTGQARVDDVPHGARILVPVSLGGSSGLARDTPVVRVDVLDDGVTAPVVRAWVALGLLGLVLWLAAVLLADRLGRSYVRPLRLLADRAGRLGEPGTSEPVEVDGPREAQELAAALNRLVARVEVLLARERENVADLSHRLRTPITSLRLRVDALPVTGADGRPSELRARLGADLDELQALVDLVVREARRSEREGLVAQADADAATRERADFWAALAEDQGREFARRLPGVPVPVGVAAEDLAAVVDVLLDNAFTHTPDDAPLALALDPLPDGGAVLVVEDGGPGLPDGVEVTRRGESGAGSTGLGLAIAARTAEASGGSCRLGRSERLGGARIEVRLGPPS